jgi:hypothetical protein
MDHLSKTGAIDKIENLIAFMSANAEFNKSIVSLAKSLDAKDDSVSIIMSALLSSTIRSIIDPNDKNNTPEMVEAIEMDSLLGSVDDIDKMKKSVKLLDQSFNNKHNRIYKLLKTLEDNSTISEEDYNYSISHEHKEVNTIVNKYLEELDKVSFGGDKNDPLNTVVALSLYAINVIRMSVYSHGVMVNPNQDTMTEILGLCDDME